MPIFAACHMSAGILGLVGNLMSALEAEDQSGNSTIGTPSAVLGIVCAGLTAAGDFLVPMYSVKSLPFKILSGITSIIVIGCKVVFSGLAQKGFKKLNRKVNVGPMICEDS
ncbi:uncharacterized protein TRIVIDRAFT_224727 [Trichoderma virens Gv29-8]|uniref:Uncharacterized protein n=1 Tax=Hypocrea virens (strain Gv29-8 / FGSC 10586) TaxID=413071 RepID=G9N164_HYPVG|nr:uncharacterized protein TRIVIDRAFT_224727 [Trichoderma virens Gv29-8]EHK19497.1 hypothetical protein TRIVIDRAFT_224727 [Trichoderma virens Gv29-8]UKZ58245.1 hypothetical protein TrVGV298_012112 [Trichoderma virens]